MQLVRTCSCRASREAVCMHARRGACMSPTGCMRSPRRARVTAQVWNALAKATSLQPGPCMPCIIHCSGRRRQHAEQAWRKKLHHGRKQPCDLAPAENNKPLKTCPTLGVVTAAALAFSFFSFFLFFLASFCAWRAFSASSSASRAAMA